MLWLAVFVAMAIVLPLNFLSPYQTLRRLAFALPLFFDQLLFMAAIGFGVMKLLVRVFPPMRVSPAP